VNALARYRRELSVAGAYGVLLLILKIVAMKSGGPSFFTNQFRGTMVEVAPTLIAAIGMTLVIVSREIDISIGGQFSICGILAGLAAKHGIPLPMAIGAAIAAGIAMGALNGALVAFAGLPSIVVTLATMIIFQQGLRWRGGGEYVTPGAATHFQWLGLPQQSGEWVLILTAFFLLSLFSVATRELAAGRTVYAVGSDREAARLAGVRPKRVIFAVFVIMGALTAVAAVLNSVRFASVDPFAGNGLELQVIAAAVVGGTAISGGRGTMIGTLAGVLLLVFIAPALKFLGSESYWQQAIQGGIILVAVASDGLARRNA
jgi:rhamnose transport system permease protein